MTTRDTAFNEQTRRQLDAAAFGAPQQRAHVEHCAPPNLRRPQQHMIRRCVRASAAAIRRLLASSESVHARCVVRSGSCGRGAPTNWRGSSADGTNVNALGAEDMTALWWAMLHSSKKGVSWLLDHGANPNITFARNGTVFLSGTSATSLAAMLADPWFLKEVLTHGGDVNYRNPLNLHTPIFDALASDRQDNVRALIAAGAEMNTYDHLQMTPLLEAAANQKFELVYDMLNAGADPTMTVARGKTNKTILTLVRTSSVSPDAPSYQWKLKVAELLRQKGLDVDHGD